MRKYQTIWERIKSEGSCTLIAHVSLHRRIKKAVTKEKYNDNSFKIFWDIEGTEQPELKTNTKGNVITFTLIKPVLLSEL